MENLNTLMNGITLTDEQKLQASKLVKLSNIINDFHGKEKITEQRLAQINECCEELKKVIAKKYPHVELKPYGSAVSGFGSKVSDADFSLTYKYDEFSRKRKFLKFLAKVAQLVKKPQQTWNVEYIATAKVPIVTLYWEGLEVDISYENRSALVNTEILKQYCMWDEERLPALGFWVKKWAKAFDICNKRNGTLSSYTFILMLIFYLQRCNEPVLPCLHSDFRSERMPGPRNYYKGVKNNWSQNTENVGELFLGFLKFYADFAFHKEMIQIRWINHPHPYRRSKELHDAIVVRDCVERRINIAEHVSHETMKKIIDIFKLSRDDVNRWITGEPMENDTMKTLFNVNF